MVWKLQIKSNYDSMSGRISCSALYTSVFRISQVRTCLVNSADTLIQFSSAKEKLLTIQYMNFCIVYMVVAL